MQLKLTYEEFVKYALIGINKTAGVPNVLNSTVEPVVNYSSGEQKPSEQIAFFYINIK